MARLTVVADGEAVAAATAGLLAGQIEASIAARGSAVVSLTGGSTPRRLYEMLGDAAQPWRSRIDWSRVHLFWGDERHVAPDHRDSNFGMARDALVAHVPLLPSHVHRMRGEIPDASQAAADYERALREGFAAAGRRDLTFDVMLLGLGEDAHIASIFPGSAILGAPGEARVAAVWAPHLNAWRITLTPSAILDARAIVMIVAGAAKAEAVRAAIEAPEDVARYPAQLVRRAGDRVTWLIDRAAASRLERPNGSES
jgi:6-phosphogluconolactonase